MWFAIRRAPAGVGAVQWCWSESSSGRFPLLRWSTAVSVACDQCLSLAAFGLLDLRLEATKVEQPRQHNPNRPVVAVALPVPKAIAVDACQPSKPLTRKTVAWETMKIYHLLFF